MDPGCDTIVAMRWLTIDGTMKRIGIIVLIAFLGFFICSYPQETNFLLNSIVNGIAALANTVAVSVATFFRTLFA